VKVNTPVICKSVAAKIAAKLLFFLAVIAAPFCVKAQTEPLANGFAHNDYKHRHPLFDALDNGFANIEADVFLQHNKLIVAHFCPLFRIGSNLEKLYFKPLYARVIENNGKVFDNYDHPVILMIDIKTGANETYRELAKLLNKYSAMLTTYQDGVVTPGAVTVVLSGHKPYKLLERETRRYAFIDEDLRKVSRDSTEANIFSMASCKYSKLLSWSGKGPIPLWQRQRLCNFVAMAHRMGSKVRLWASPENKVVWNELLSCGVDLINTDKLSSLRDYLSTGHTSTN